MQLANETAEDYGVPFVSKLHFFRHCVFHGYLHTFHGYLQITVEYAWLFMKSMVIYEKHGYL